MTDFTDDLEADGLEWAFQNGDESYLVFTGGKPIEKPPVTYHEENTDD